MIEETTAEIGKEIDDAINTMEAEEKQENVRAEGEGVPEQDADTGHGEVTGEVVGKEDQGNEPSAGGGSEDPSGDQDEGAGEGGSESGQDEPIEPPALDGGLLARAVSMGITLTEAKEFQDDASLGNFMDELARNSTAEEVVPVEPPTKKEDEDDLLDKLPDLDPEIYGKEAIELFGKLIGKAKEQQEEISGLRADQARTVSSVAASSEKEVESFFDDAVAGLLKEEGLKDTLGEGGIRSIRRGSAQYAKREAIAQEMGLRLAGFTAQGVVAPPREEVFADAARFVLADEYRAIEKKKLSDELGDRAGQHIQRGSSGKGKQKISAEEETANLLAEKFNFG